MQKILAPGADLFAEGAKSHVRSIIDTSDVHPDIDAMVVMPSGVSTTSTRAMLAAAESRGVETGDLLAAFGLGREVMEDPNARIAAPTALALWDALRERCADPALQLSAPTVLPFGAYRVIDYLVYSSPTVRDGVTRFAKFFRLIADAVCLTIESDGDGHSLRIVLSDGCAAPGVYVDYVFAALVGRIRMQIRPELRVRRVELCHLAPPDPSPYHTCFQAPVVFGAAGDRLWFDGEEWHAPIEHADAALAALLEEHARMLSAHIPDPATEFVGDVRQALMAALPDDATTGTVARALHVSVRTLQRKLAAAGTSFRDLSHATLKGLAVGYLEDPEVSISEVAFLLGFSDQASFTRAFRRWTGAPPGAWRRRTRG